jgi:hypothetical protein
MNENKETTQTSNYELNYLKITLGSEVCHTVEMKRNKYKNYFLECKTSFKDSMNS